MKIGKSIDPAKEKVIVDIFICISLMINYVFDIFENDDTE